MASRWRRRWPTSTRRCRPAGTGSRPARCGPRRRPARTPRRTGPSGPASAAPDVGGHALDLGVRVAPLCPVTSAAHSSTPSTRPRSPAAASAPGRDGATAVGDDRVAVPWIWRNGTGRSGCHQVGASLGHGARDLGEGGDAVGHLAGQPGRHHGPVGDACHVHPPPVDRQPAGHAVDQGGDEADVVDDSAFRGGGRRSTFVEAVGRHHRETLPIGQGVEPGQPVEPGAVAPAAVELDDQRRAERQHRRDVDAVGPPPGRRGSRT